jgi:hypothetical protein
VSPIPYTTDHETETWLPTKAPKKSHSMSSPPWVEVEPLEFERVDLQEEDH